MNVLLTAIGSMSALCAINNLHKAEHKVIGCDIYPKEWHYEASVCDVFRQAPYATSDEYIPFLIRLAKENNVDYIFPLTDLEIDVINKKRELFENEGITICMSSKKTLSVVRDKLALYEIFKDDDRVLSVPTFTFAESIASDKGQAVLYHSRKGHRKHLYRGLCPQPQRRSIFLRAA